MKQSLILEDDAIRQQLIKRMSEDLGNDSKRWKDLISNAFEQGVSNYRKGS